MQKSLESQKLVKTYISILVFLLKNPLMVQTRRLNISNISLALVVPLTNFQLALCVEEKEKFTIEQIDKKLSAKAARGEDL